MMDEDLQTLLVSWTSGLVDSQVVAPMIERLKHDKAFRDAFIAEIVLLGQLKAVQSSEPSWLELEDILGAKLPKALTDADFEAKVMNHVIAIPPSTLPFHKSLLWPLVVFANVVVLLLMWLTYHRSERVDSPIFIEGSSDGDWTASHASEATQAGGVGILSQSVGVKWLGEFRPEVGDALNQGDLRIESGTIQIEFFTGVRLLVRGPADIELRAANEVLLRQGLASCFVTELGRGFRILTKDLQVIDLGTAFSISVQEGVESEIHVLEGAVEIQSPSIESRELKQRQAVRIAATGPKDIAFAPHRFPQPAEVLLQQDNLDRQRLEAWRNSAAHFNDDPELLLHYDFEEDGSNPRELTNRASDSSHASDGGIIGCEWTEGRWPNKRALQFRNTGDRVIFQVPGAFEQLTFLTWLRIDGLTQPLTSILVTEEPIRRKNLNPHTESLLNDELTRRNQSHVKSVRWQMYQSTPGLMFSIAFAEGEYERFPVDHHFPSPANWGKWTCIAVTCDVTTGKVIQYCNGARMSEHSLKHADPLLLDFMTLGNLSVSNTELKKSNGQAQRRFFGAFDELIIAKRVLSDKEIRAFWETGQP